MKTIKLPDMSQDQKDYVQALLNWEERSAILARTCKCPIGGKKARECPWHGCGSKNWGP